METLTDPLVVLSFVFVWSVVFGIRQLSFDKRLKDLEERLWLEENKDFVLGACRDMEEPMPAGFTDRPPEE